ncbi:galanin receptor 2b-like [Patiria miniata]|uniref:G-protein coupled receptors family 1 profile domain-containing protein n=1 Tax=Patiria miniata TaxID=46514 RepID=A0A914AK99_PATMI|nr:galanin receptor 2b-like [Patiria miniata]
MEENTTFSTETSVAMETTDQPESSLSTISDGSPDEYALNVVYGIIGCLGILGNGLVCTVFLMRRKVFGSSTNLLILNQSMIDLVDSILTLILRFGPHMSDQKHDIWGELACRIWFSEYIIWSLFVASTVNLLFVSLERYFAICHAVKHRKLFTPRRANIGRVIVWIVGFLYQSYWAALHTFSHEGCYPYWPSPTIQKIGGVFFFCCEYLIPLSIMSFSYASIVIMLRKKSNSTTHANTFHRAKRNVTLTLCMVFLSYTACWTPTEIAYIRYNLGGEYDFESTLHRIFTALVLGNMCVNPIIYTFKYERFQVELKRIVLRRNRVGDSNIIDVTARTQAGSDQEGPSVMR